MIHVLYRWSDHQYVDLRIDIFEFRQYFFAFVKDCFHVLLHLLRQVQHVMLIAVLGKRYPQNGVVAQAIRNLVFKLLRRVNQNIAVLFPEAI